MSKIGDRFYSLGAKHKFWLLLAVGFGILLHIFVFQSFSSLIAIALVVLWILSIWLYKFKGRVSVTVALSFLILCSLLLMFGLEEITEKVATWAFTFLWLGVGQMFIEYIKEKRY